MYAAITIAVNTNAIIAMMAVGCCQNGVCVGVVVWSSVVFVCLVGWVECS